MNRTRRALRALAALLRGRKGAVRHPTSLAATGALAAAIALSLTAAGGTTALWTGSVSVTPPSIRSGSVTALLEGFTGLSHTFTSSALTKTSYIKVSNTGESDADYTVSLSLGAGSSSSLAGTTTVTVWATTAPANCTETAWPSSAGTWAWNAVPVFSGPISAGGNAIYCLRSRTAAANLTTSASITPQISVVLTVPGTGWSSSASASATQSVVPDASVLGNDYTDAVRADGAVKYWRLGETSGSVLYDQIGSDDAYAGTGLTRGVAGAFTADADTATTFSGTSTGTSGTRILSPSTNTFALEAWFKTTTTTGGRIVGFSGNSTGVSSTYDRHIYLDGTGKVHFGVWPGSSKVISTTTSYNDGQWHHVVGNLGPSGMSFYVDGAHVGTITAVTTGWTYNGYWRIGGDNSWAGDYWFDGTIDEVALYSAPLSANKIANHWNLSGRGLYPAGVGDPYGSTVYGDSPSLFWRLGESSGTTAADSTGNGFTGVYSGGVTQGVTGAVPGTRNTAGSFNGSNGLVYSSHQFVNPQNYSLELWFNTTTTTGGKLIGFGNAQTGPSSSYDRHLYLQSDGKLVFGTHPGSPHVAVSPAALNDGQWHHVVATQSSEGMKMFVDGDLVAVNSATTSADFNGYWRVGGDNLNGWSSTASTYYVTAKIDEVAVYDTVLTSTQIKRHYSVATGVPVAAFTSSISGLAATFDGAASSDYDGSIASYSWNWGDGTAAGSGATASHNYTAPGTYTVTLTVTDNAGRTDTVTGTVTATDSAAPSTPGTPTVTSNTGTTVGLTWTASNDNVAVSGYDVFRDGTFVTTVASNSWTDTGRALNTTYTYTVRARDASGNLSALSGSVSVTTRTVNTAVWYQVKPWNGFCLVSTSPTTYSGLTQNTCATSTSQNFQFQPTTGGYYRVGIRSHPTYVWNVSGASMNPGASIILYPISNTWNEQWLPTIVSTSTTTTTINGTTTTTTTRTYTFTQQGSGLCLTVPGSSTAAGTQLTQDTCVAGASNQRFTLVEVP